MHLKCLCSVICLTINNFNCFYLKIALPQQEKEVFSGWTMLEKELHVSGTVDYLILFPGRDKHSRSSSDISPSNRADSPSLFTISVFISSFTSSFQLFTQFHEFSAWELPEKWALKTQLRDTVSLCILLGEDVWLPRLIPDHSPCPPILKAGAGPNLVLSFCSCFFFKGLHSLLIWSKSFGLNHFWILKINFKKD